MVFKVTTLGTGMTEDPTRVNSAYLIETPDTVIQVDAGFGVYAAFARHYGHDWVTALTTEPDLFLVTHDHADHKAELASRFALDMWRACTETGTSRDFLVYGEKRAIDSFIPDCGSAYRHKEKGSFYDFLYSNALRFSLNPVERSFSFRGFTITPAPTEHSLENLGYRIEKDGVSAAISGDGKPTSELRKAFEGADFMIYHAFNVDNPHGSHSTLQEVVDLAKELKIRKVAIAHMDNFPAPGKVPERAQRAKIEYYTKKAQDSGIDLWLPNDGDAFVLSEKDVTYKPREN